MPKKKRVISVYRVTREYGGPEEGGWYYDNYERVHTEPLDPRKNKKLARKKRLKLQDQYIEDLAYGDINSVLGGETYWAGIESIPGENETKERPYYC